MSTQSPATPAFIVMTVLGADSPGIVHRVASILRAHEGSWLESRMARLGGQFAGIVEARLPELQLTALKEAMAKLADEGLRVIVEESQTGQHFEAEQPSKHLQIELLCPDRPGILRDLTALLAERKVNVEELSSRIVAAQFSGEPLFKARLRLSLGEAIEPENLRAAIEELATGLMLDISIHQY
jgi:glycine cleavage system regulatory protein